MPIELFGRSFLANFQLPIANLLLVASVDVLETTKFLLFVKYIL